MNKPHQPDQSTLNQLAPDSVPDGIQHHRAHEDLRQSEEKYRRLFETMDTGFAVGEAMRDEWGKMVNYRLTQVNPAFEKLTGLDPNEAVGKPILDVLPGLDAWWFDTYQQVVDSGETVHVEEFLPQLNRWYGVTAFYYGEEQFATYYNDITERKQSQQQQAFLLKFSDTLRAQLNADTVTNGALQLLLEELGLDRCYVGVYRLEEDRGEFTHQVGNDRVPPVPDGVRLSDFPDALQVAFEGTLVIDEVSKTAGLTEMDRQNLSALGFSALVASTLRHGERNPLWSIVAISARPRHWRPAEIKLIEDVTERTWTAIERVKAEQALRMNEQRIRIQKEAFQSAINGEPLASSLNTLTRMVNPQLGSEVRTVFYLAYPDGASLHAIEGAGDMPQTYTGPVDGFPIGEASFCSGLAIATGRPALTRDVFEDPLWQPYLQLAAAHSFRACSSYPILTRDGKAVGCFALYFSHVHEATAEEFALAEAVTQAAAIILSRHTEALERARAEEALRASESRTSFLLGLTDTLRPLSNPVDIQYQAARVLGEFLRANRIGYASTQEDDKLVAVTLHYKQGVGGIEGVYSYVDYGPQLLSDMQVGKTVIRPDIAQDPTLSEAEKAAHKRLQLGATVNVPLVKQGRLVAILFVHFQQVHVWSADEVTLIEETAERIWTALERARADEALREGEARLAQELADSQQLQLISSRLIEADNLKGLYQQIMEAAKAIMHADTVSMQRFFPDQKALHLLAWQGFDPESAHFWEWVDVNSASSCGRALLAGKRVIVPDVDADASMQDTGDLDAYRRSGLRSVQTTPLISRSGQIVGMLSNHWRTVHTPTERELGLLDVIARQAADIVERHQAAEALGQSEERFRTLVQNLPDYAIFRIDPTGRITEWTEGAQRVKGYAAEEVMGEPISLFYTPEGLAAGELTAEMEQATQSGRAERESIRIRKGGERFWVNEIMTAIRDGAGRLVGFTKISRDITRPKQAQEALRDSQQRLQIVLNSIADHAIITYDPLNHITSWNAGAEQLFGYTEDEAIGQLGNLIFTPEDRATNESAKELETACRLGWAADERFHLRKNGSRLYLSGVMSPLYAADDQLLGYVKVARDLTDRRHLEQTLREADQRKDEFLAMLAHELRNPMSTIRSGLQILTLSAGDEETTQATVAMINRQTDHLVRLVDDLLDVSRISRGKIELRNERVNIVELVSQAAQAVDPLYQSQSRRLTVALPASPIYVEGDATRLGQVVTNLLTNGLRYTQAGGQVWLTLEHQDGKAILEVRDNGIGLVKDQLSAIFELFVQVDNSLARTQGGLGLGLTLVKRLVELHGGRVAARSDGLGQGSTFTVHLPTLTNAAETRPSAREGLTDQAARLRLLIVDDNPDAALTLSMLLRLKGYEVHTQNSGRAGIEAAESLAPKVLLLDIGMPDMDGYETCQLIREQPWGQAMIVIALTGYGQDDDRQRTQQAGFDGHLVKPVDLAVLLKLITELINQE